jgi:2-methylcitrate dehydratase PrpD
LYACCGHAYPAVTAALALRNDLLPRLEAIRTIEAEVYKASAALTNPAPRSVEEAKFSLPYLLAIALVHGDLSHRAMSMEAITDPRVQALAARVGVQENSVIAGAFPRLRSAELVLTMADGSQIRKYVDAPLGMPENPVGWDELEAKFVDAAQDIFGARRASEIVARVRDTDRLASVTALTSLLKF